MDHGALALSLRGRGGVRAMRMVISLGQLK